MFDVSSAIIQIYQQLLDIQLKNDSGWFEPYIPIVSVIIAFVLGMFWNCVYDWYKNNKSNKKIISLLIDELKDEKMNLKDEIFKHIENIEKLLYYVEGKRPESLSIRHCPQYYLLSSDDNKEMFYMLSSTKNKKNFKRLLKCYNYLYKHGEKINCLIEEMKETREVQGKYVSDISYKNVLIMTSRYINMGINTICYIDGILDEKEVYLNTVDEIIDAHELVFNYYFNKDYQEWHDKRIALINNFG